MGDKCLHAKTAWLNCSKSVTLARSSMPRCLYVMVVLREIVYTCVCVCVCVSVCVCFCVCVCVCVCLASD